MFKRNRKTYFKYENTTYYYTWYSRFYCEIYRGENKQRKSKIKLVLKQRSCVKILHNQIIETQKNCPEDEIIKDAKIFFKLEKDYHKLV